MKVKEELYQQCQDFVNNRLKTVEKTISSHQKALQSETKSSAGDKHETGRAMLQLEMEKASQQLEAIQIMQQTLSKIDVSEEASVIRLGSTIETNIANYFLAISSGQITVAGKQYFAVSASSPIGKLLLGKKKGDVFDFNGKKIKIEHIL